MNGTISTEISAGPWKIFLLTVLWKLVYSLWLPLKGFSNKDICVNGLLEGDWPHLEPALSLVVQRGRPAGLFAASCSGALSSAVSRKSNCSSDIYMLDEAEPVDRATCGLLRGSLLLASRGARQWVHIYLSLSQIEVAMTGRGNFS